MSDEFPRPSGDCITDRMRQRAAEAKAASSFAAPLGSATGEPRVKTLLRSMMAALDRDDADTYWVTFGMLLSLHEEIMKSPNDKLRHGGENQ